MKQKAFSAFPDQGLQFLHSLKRNNNRDWFHSHKSIYEQYVKHPMTKLIAGHRQKFQRFAPEILGSHRVAGYGIYRDTRVSNDKSPYKIHIAVVFPRSGQG